MGEVATCRVVNETRGTVVGNRIEIAAAFSRRLIGLLCRPRLNDGEGLFIPNCRSVHSFFLRFPIEIIGLDRDGRVGFAGRLPRGKVLRPSNGVVSILELPVGTLERSGTNCGDHLSVSPAGS